MRERKLDKIMNSLNDNIDRIIEETIQKYIYKYTYNKYKTDFRGYRFVNTARPTSDMDVPLIIHADGTTSLTYKTKEGTGRRR